VPPLNATGARVQVGRAVLRTPGLAGTASEIPPGGSTQRAATLSSNELETVLAAHNVTRQQVIELRDTREVDAGGSPTRSTRLDGTVIELEVPDPGPKFGQVVLATDEAGIVNWSLARDQTGALATSRGAGGSRTYLIKRTVGAAPTGPGSRGVIGAIGKKLLQVLVFPLIDPVLGAVAEGYARTWEQAHRPYQVRTFTTDNYTQPGSPIDEHDWGRLAAGRSLLFVHGTFARAHGAFPTLPRSVMQQLEQTYGGRLFAFDHYTVSEDPLDNARRLAASMPEGLKLDLDIVCHSRGGLVARALAESSELQLAGRELRIGRVAFVASPNGGCVLADPDGMSHFIDRYSNWVNFIPAGPVIDMLEGVVTVAKLLAVGAMKGLVGLESMVPHGGYLTKVNAGSPASAHYFALASNYEPTDQNLRSFAHNLLMDQIFGTENDLVVPTAGVYDANGAGSFPIAADDRHVFAAADGIDHGGFFANPAAQTKLLEWLVG
jgi:hypothetical protein